jgi:hypothetical protein
VAACPKCSASCADDAQFCAKCGAVVGADAGALERLIDERARQIVAEEKDRERAEEQRAAEEDQKRRQRENARDQRDDAKKELDANRAEPVGIFGACLASMRRVLITAAIFGVFPGILLHTFLIPAFGTSPAGVVCPAVCDGCTAPAKTFSWNYKGSWHSENGQMGYAFVCTNPKIDVAKLTESDIWDSHTNDALQPYMLNSFAVWFVEYALLLPIAVLVLGPFFGVRRRKRTLDKRRPLEEALARAQARLDALEAKPPEPTEPYR